jgi:hypothetical protein
MTLCASVVQAQVSPSGLPVTGSPAAVGYAGGGAAAAGDPARASEFTALLGLETGSALFGTISLGAEGIDTRSYSIGAATSISSSLQLGILSRWREVENLIEDPAVAGSGLRVGDWELHLGLAQSLAGKRFVLAGSAAYTKSTILGTSGALASLGASVLLVPASRFRLLLAADGLGPATRYADAGGTIRHAAQLRRWRGSAAVRLLRLASVEQLLYLDYERTTDAAKSEMLAVATDASIGNLLVLRAGLALRRDIDAGTGWGRSLGAGFQVHVSSVVLDYGYAASLPRDDLAPRHHFGVSWLRP